MFSVVYRDLDWVLFYFLSYLYGIWYGCFLGSREYILFFYVLYYKVSVIFDWY